MFTFTKTTDEHIKQLQAAVKRAICTNHNAKMAGMISLSTSPLLNDHCAKMRAAAEAAKKAGKENLPICGSCYACKMCKQYKSLADKLAINSRLLSSSILPPEALPLLNCQVFRLESFGDVINNNHLENLVNLVNKNKGVRFALWSKHIALVSRFFDKHEKPHNLILIASSPTMNKQIKLPRHFDKVFTVYENETAAEKANVAINCGARDCLTCQRCYKRSGAVFVNELLK